MIGTGRTEITAAIDANPGTYALVLRSSGRHTVQVGRWGCLAMRRGYYLYIGSAFGPGGVKARVSRHCRADKRRHWQVDYLREYTEPVAVWYSHSTRRLEHGWAAAMGRLPGLAPVVGFGCSDCTCAAHLFFATSKPRLADFSQAVDCEVKAWDCPKRGQEARG